MVIQEAGFEDMEQYVLKRQNTVAQYITARPIMNLYKETVQMLGMWLKERWQKQEGLDLAGDTATATAADEEREWGEPGKEEAYYGVNKGMDKQSSS